MRQTILDDRRSAGLGLSVRLLLCSVCLAHSAMALLRAQQNDGAIYGRITDSRGQPQRLLVHLAAEGDVPAGDVFTDSNGQYTFSGLPNGTYWVVVEAKDYRPVRQYVMLDLRIHPKAQANIALELLERYEVGGRRVCPERDENGILGNEQRDRCKSYHGAHLYRGLGGLAC